MTHHSCQGRASRKIKCQGDSAWQREWMGDYGRVNNIPVLGEWFGRGSHVVYSCLWPRHASSSLRLSHQGKLQVMYCLALPLLTTHTSAPSYRRFRYDAPNTVLSHSFLMKQPRRCWQVVPPPSFLRRCMDSFLHYNHRYWFQDPYYRTRRQAHQTSDSELSYKSF